MSSLFVPKSLNLLDCTLRDGGYYNNWDFSLDVVNSYLSAIESVDIDIIEIGFRFTDSSHYLGPFAFTSDNFLNIHDIKSSAFLAVMINAADFIDNNTRYHDLALLFPFSCDDTRIDIVRIACHFSHLIFIHEIVSFLKTKGFTVFINIMQAAQLFDNISSLDNLVNCPFDVLYIADSTGSLTPAHIPPLYQLLSSRFDVPLGLHAHNNMGLALSNSLQAIDSGFSFIDTTLLGMGRGAGNTLTEQLLVQLSDSSSNYFNLTPLYTLIEKYFIPLKSHFNWGPNMFYHIAGKHSIHPSYVQSMLSDSRFSPDDVFLVLDFLKSTNALSFSYKNISNGLNFYSSPPSGTCDPSELINSDTALILGPGPSTKLHNKAISSFIHRHKPVVLSLNTLDVVDSSLVDYSIACHPIRILADSAKYNLLSRPLVLPYSMLPESVSSSINTNLIIDYGINISSNSFNPSPYFCTIPEPLVFPYSLAFLSASNVKTIYLCGFDGYDSGDPRNDQMDTFFELYSLSSPVQNLLSLTPSSYKNLNSTSIYAF